MNIKITFTYTYLLFVIILLFVFKIPEIIIITLSIIIHELSHFIASFIFGNRKFHLKISMIGGLCNLDINKLSKTKKIIVYISGVISNLFIILIFKDNKYIDIIKKYNYLLIIFSLLPIYPLDGFRILREFIDIKILKKISIFILIALFIYNVYLQSLGILIVLIYLLIKQKNINNEELYNKLSLLKSNL